MAFDYFEFKFKFELKTESGRKIKENTVLIVLRSFLRSLSPVLVLTFDRVGHGGNLFPR